MIKPKTNTPLLVNAYAPLPYAVVLQSFQPVGWRQTQIFNCGSGIQLCKPHNSAAQNFWRQAARFTRDKKLFGFSIGKACYHTKIINKMFTICNINSIYKVC